MDMIDVDGIHELWATIAVVEEMRKYTIPKDVLPVLEHLEDCSYKRFEVLRDIILSNSRSALMKLM